MSLLDTVQSDLMAAMKGQDKVRTAALRMLKTALKNAEIEANKKLEPTAEAQIVMKLCKQRRESMEIFEKNGRHELAQNEQAELAVIETYLDALPKGLSDEDLASLIAATIKETGANQPKQMGQVMGAVLKKLAGQTVDNKKVSELVKAQLAGAG